jgi:enoyl-CoA hydratase/carnithine racemase
MTAANPDPAAADEAPSLAIEARRATIRLRRPREHNRIDPDDIPVLVDHFDRIERTPDVDLVVVTGTGTKTFSSGYTIDAIRTRLDASFERMLDRLEGLAVPTLCALNGSVYGGATDLALCCDFRVGVAGTRMFMPAARFGLHYYPGGLRRFVTRLGPSATKKIFLTGLTLHADEMLRIGFLTELVARDALEATVDAYANALAQCDRGVVRSMKRHIDGLAAGRWQEADGRRAYADSLASDELARRVEAHRRR